MAKGQKADNKDTQMDNLKPARYGDQEMMTGAGGEVHQTAAAGTAKLTTQQGVPVSDDQNSISAVGHHPIGQGGEGVVAVRGQTRARRRQVRDEDRHGAAFNGDPRAQSANPPDIDVD